MQFRALVCLWLASAATARDTTTPRPTTFDGAVDVLSHTSTPAPTPRPTTFDGVFDNRSLRTAVEAWFSDRAAAIQKYGHISTWETGGVTSMSCLFSARTDYICPYSNWDAEKFNANIGAWDTSSVTTMFGMFYSASAFNRDIGAWDTSGVERMSRMFDGASAFNQDIGAWDTSGVRLMNSMFSRAGVFDQDLGWCVADDAYLDDAFSNSGCESTWCGVSWGGCDVPSTGNVMANGKIRLAVAAWLANATAAEATYGHISTWATGGVTDMSELFCAYSGYPYYSDCNTAAASFNEDIGAWDTSGVTTMSNMFRGSWNNPSAFNQDIGNWTVQSVRDMYRMFNDASAFNQTLGWCVRDDAVDDLEDAFDDTLCESTSCGVAQGQFKMEDGGCESTPAPTPGTDAARRGGRAAVALVVGGVLALLA